MNHCLYGAGRTTHLKVVVLSLLCAFVFAAVGLTARVGEMSGARASSHVETTGLETRGGPNTMTSQ